MQIAVLTYGIGGLVTLLLDAHSSFWIAAMQGSVFALLASIGVMLQVFVKKYHSCLSRKSEDKSDIIKFAFTCGKLAQLHLKNFRDKNQKVIIGKLNEVPNHYEQPVDLESIAVAI